MEWACPCGGVNEESASRCTLCGASRPERLVEPAAAVPLEAEEPPASEAVTPPPPTPPRKRKTLALAGASAVFILLGLCLIGISSAVTLPGMLKKREAAKERLRQEMATSDMRHLAECCRAFAEVNRHYPLVRDADPAALNITSASELKRVLASANACPSCPALDPWGTEYRYGATADGSEFALLCFGLGGRQDAKAVPEAHVGTSCFEDDIIWLNDGFIQEPEGAQKRCGE